MTPYFVAGKNGVALLAGARQRGARVVVITNSLASTNSVSVHSGYRRYRRALLEAGVELYEIKPTASSRRRRSGGGWFRSMASGGSMGAGSSLHAKAFAFDRGIGFVGSYNLDPRSSRLNTEMGVVFECPPLAKRLPEENESDLAHTAYRVELDGRRLVWVTHEGDTGSASHVRARGQPAEAHQGEGAELAADRVDALMRPDCHTAAEQASARYFLSCVRGFGLAAGARSVAVTGKWSEG